MMSERMDCGDNINEERVINLSYTCNLSEKSLEAPNIPNIQPTGPDSISDIGGSVEMTEWIEQLQVKNDTDNQPSTSGEYLHITICPLYCLVITCVIHINSMLINIRISIL